MTNMYDFKKLEALHCAKHVDYSGSIQQRRAQREAQRTLVSLFEAAKKERPKLEGTLSVFEEFIEALSYFPDLSLPVDFKNCCELARTAKTLGFSLSAKQIQRALETLGGIKLENGRARRIQFTEELKKLEEIGQHLHVNKTLNKDEVLIVKVIALKIVRMAAFGLLKKPYAEGIDDVDIQDAVDKILEFAKNLHQLNSLSEDLGNEFSRFMTALGDYDASVPSDLELVERGSRLVAILDEASGFLTLTANLSVLQVAKHLLPLDYYSDSLAFLSDQVKVWHKSDEAKRVKSMEPGLPSPIRVSTMASVNNATYIGALLVDKDEAVTSDTQKWIARANAELEKVKQSGDSGSNFAKAGKTIFLAAKASVTGDSDEITKHFKSMGEAKAALHLAYIDDVEDSDALVNMVIGYATEVFPDLKTPSSNQ